MIRQPWLVLLLLLGTSGGSLAAAPPPCAPPLKIDDGWRTAELEAAGFDPLVLCAVLEDVAAGTANVHAVVVERHGRLAAELYRPGKDRSIWSLFARETRFAPNVLHDLRSISKSVV